MENQETQTQQINQETQQTTTQTNQFNLNELVGKYDSKTGITQDIKNVLNSNNIPVELFESHIKMKEIELNTIKTKAMNVFGNDSKAHDTVIEWANKNIDENSLNAISQLINNPATVEIAMAGLKLQYEKATNKQIQTQNQNVQPQTQQKFKNFGTDEVIRDNNTVKINTKADLVSLYRSVEYKTNPSFRDKVSKAMIEAQKNGIL